MTTQDAINRQMRKIAKLEQVEALGKIKKRKVDTRKKIELGGLVVKSKMADYSKVVILGALISAYEQLEQEEGTFELFKHKGTSAFMEHKEIDNGQINQPNG